MDENERNNAGQRRLKKARANQVFPHATVHDLNLGADILILVLTCKKCQFLPYFNMATNFHERQRKYFQKSC